ncbi:phosphoribosyltransferase family protein [Glaciihabitans sp. dw_435]|uniref:phosphoribosyltransferase family protein n=1 Tax=Glaciihabitans sp. dw_435 TaxID=2720081 RepID=UPI001BD68A26|nr:phosphoribosyltransferase family protein [Glaciihabitans sp. dw_435]
MTAATYDARIGSQTATLPLVPVSDTLTIALFMTIDHGVAFLDVAGRELAEQLRPLEPEIVVSAATLGIPVAIEVTRHLGLDDYLILQKSQKVHLRDALRESVRAITSDSGSEFLLDQARIPAIAGKRVVFVDDVLSSGSSVAAALRLLDRAGAIVVGIGVLLEEGDDWRDVLGERAALVRSLGTIPLFPTEAPTA